MLSPDTVRALLTVAIVFGTAASAVVVSTHPTDIPPAGTPPPGSPPAFTGDRISLSNYVEIPPPDGCLAMTFPTDEAALRTFLGTVYEWGNWGYPEGGPIPLGGARGDTQATTAGGAVPPSAPDYSGTNNQVAGVDEADMVKTDGWFIYTATGGRIVIATAYPAEAMARVSTIELGGYAYGIFVFGDRMAVVLQPQYPSPVTYSPGISADSMMMPYYYNPEVEVRVYDISDRAAPSILYNYSMSGSYQGARMVGDYLYLVSDYSIYRVGEDLRLPTVSRNGILSELAPSSIGVPPGTLNTTYLTSVITVNISAGENVRTFSFLAQGGGQLFVSARNLYILGSSWEYTADYKLLRTETVITKLSFYKGSVGCYFGARVPGTVLNQFSADETATVDHTYLRLATTTRAGDWANSSAGVYVLDEKLNLVGKVEGIAPGETVQTSRFMGDRGYIVTFRRVDPLFVLNLSDPANPRVVGELTLPGFSQYLQAIDANHLIGIGVEGTLDGRTGGLKISLFDVSDPAHPFEVSGTTFGGYAYSEAQYDHHAVLYIASRGLLVIPVQTYDYTVDSRSGGTSFTGAVVYAVDVSTGFTEKARISHPAVVQVNPYGGESYSYTPSIRRSLWIGDNLYTVSDNAIMANSFADLAHVSGYAEIGTPLPWYYGYYGGGGVATTGGGTVATPPPTA